MTWSAAHIEERGETNAEGRARQYQKGSAKAIKGKDSFRAVLPGKTTHSDILPGKLKISVDYTNGCLNVYLDSASELAGKRSQDPYALCYLLAKDGRCYFEKGNNKTTTFNKSLTPSFKHQFKFLMSLDDINIKSLVVSIWDEDSSSRDDFMAGLKLSMKQVQYFQNRNLVELELQHQEIDGHPAAISELTMKTYFRIVVTSLHSWDLKTCNNHLVAFIDRARVLAEAYEIKGSLPSTLKERTSMLPPDASRLFDEEIMRLKREISRTRSKLVERRSERDSLKLENGHLVSAFEKYQYTLKERQSTLYSLELKESELSGRVVGVDYLSEQIRVLEMRIKQERQRVEMGRNSWQDVTHVKEEALYIPNLGGINMGQSKLEQERKSIEIRIRNEFLLRMRAALNKARQSYQLKYQEFIMKIERDADEIMRLYEDIIRERALKSADTKSNLLDLERSRAYQLRINQLLADIRDFDSKIGNLEGKLGGIDADYRNKMVHLDGDLNALKQKLRDLFAKFSAFAQTRYNETNELSIYNNLLNFEEGRLTTSQHKVQRKVTVSESVVRNSHAADITLQGSMTGGYGQSYSTSTYKKNESGYSSPANTPSSVHGGGMGVFEFGDGVSYGEQRMSSTTTTRGSRNSAGSNVFTSIKGEIMEQNL